MRNITLSADAVIIRQARRRAAIENTTVNELFRQWLERYTSQPTAAEQYLALMARLEHVQTSRAYSREEMNERN